MSNEENWKSCEDCGKQVLRAQFWEVHWADATLTQQRQRQCQGDDRNSHVCAWGLWPSQACCVSPRVLAQGRAHCSCASQTWPVQRWFWGEEGRNWAAWEACQPRERVRLECGPDSAHAAPSALRLLYSSRNYA